MIKTKTCPACSKSFTRRTKGSCPNCSEGLHLLNGKVYTLAEKEAVDSLLRLLEETISDRDNVPFVFDVPAANRERALLYQVILRSRDFLGRVSNKHGWTPATFTIDLLSQIIEDWARPWIQSYVQINKSISTAALELYRARKQQEIVEKNQRSTFVELGKFVQGDGYACHPGYSVE